MNDLFDVAVCAATPKRGSFRSRGLGLGGQILSYSIGCHMPRDGAINERQEASRTPLAPPAARDPQGRDPPSG